MQFTHREWELINHRLEKGDEVAEALLDNWLSGEAIPTADTIVGYCNALIRCGKTRDFRSMIPIERSIILEACKGSNFLVGMSSDPNIHPRQLRMWRSVAESLGSMLKIKVPVS